MKTLGGRIRELRDSKDLSLREFAKKLGNISPAHISDIENGNRNPSKDLLAKMAHLLEVDVAELQRLDTRPPVEDWKRLIKQNPSFGFALRKLAESDASPDEILKFADQKASRKSKNE